MNGASPPRLSPEVVRVSPFPFIMATTVLFRLARSYGFSNMDYLTGALGRCAVPRRRRRRRLPGRQRFAARDNISLPDFLLSLHCMGIQSRRTICAFIYFIY